MAFHASRILLLAVILPMTCYASGHAAGVPVFVQFDQDVGFVTHDGRPIPIAAGPYRVEIAGDDQLRLIPEKNGPTALLPARALLHEEKIDSPLAVTIPRPDGTRHLVYLVPGGKGLVAVGTTGNIRERGLLSSTLTSDEVKLYVALKLEQSAKTPPAADPARQAHDEAVRTLLDLLRTQPGGLEIIAQARQQGAVLPSSNSGTPSSHKEKSRFYSIALTEGNPRSADASLTINARESSATLRVKISRGGWYIVNFQATIQSAPLEASLSVLRVIKTVAGKAGRSSPLVVRSWNQTAQPGESLSFPALVQLKPGEHELTWTLRTGSANAHEARLLSL